MSAGQGLTYIGQGKRKGRKLRKDIGARNQTGPDTYRCSGSPSRQLGPPCIMKIRQPLLKIHTTRVFGSQKLSLGFL